MSLDLDRLLRPISAALPAGENLEYDPAFEELFRDAAGRPERRMGDAVIQEEPPDLQRLGEGALSLMERTKDLRVATLLTRTALSEAGLEGLGEGLELVRRLLDELWTSVHPQVDDQDEDDLVIRHSALSGLVAPELLEEIRRERLWRGRRSDAPTVQDLLRAAGETTERDGREDLAASDVDSACRAAGPAVVRDTLETIEQCRKSLAAIGQAFREHARSTGPDLSRTDELLRQLGASLAPYDERSTEAASATASVDAGERPDAVPLPLASRPQNRGQVLAMLKLICDYYDEREPSSPVPLLLRRCQRLCTLSFREIVEDLTPVALKELDVIAGKGGTGEAAGGGRK